MKKCYLDANVLICYKNEESLLFEEAKELITSLIEDSYKIYLSPLVLDEFLHPIQFLLKKKKIKKIYPVLKKALKDILSLPNLEIVNPPLEKAAQLRVVSLMKKFNLKARDAYHLLAMQENHIPSFATFDNDFKIVFEKKVVGRV